MQARTDAAPAFARTARSVSAQGRAGRIEAFWAECESDLRDAQRLRHRVFAEELGARISPVEGAPCDTDADRFDPFCDHLLVRVVPAEGRDDNAPVIGTYRVLSPQAARRAGGLYTDTEFDLTPLQAVRAHAVELGRSCVHPAWRSGAVIMALWSALGEYMRLRELDTMIGCASVSLDDGGQAAAQLWHRLRHTHLASAQWQVQPRIALPVDKHGEAGESTLAPSFSSPGSLNGALPPLIKGYLRCGARVLGPPAMDRTFNTADLPIMLRTSEMTPRYRRHFLGD
jgi:putative hemolysin